MRFNTCEFIFFLFLSEQRFMASRASKWEKERERKRKSIAQWLCPFSIHGLKALFAVYIFIFFFSETYNHKVKWLLVWLDFVLFFFLFSWCCYYIVASPTSQFVWKYDVNELAMIYRTLIIHLNWTDYEQSGMSVQWKNLVNFTEFSFEFLWTKYESVIRQARNILELNFFIF